MSEKQKNSEKSSYPKYIDKKIEESAKETASRLIDPYIKIEHTEATLDLDDFIGEELSGIIIDALHTSLLNPEYDQIINKEEILDAAVKGVIKTIEEEKNKVAFTGKKRKHIVLKKLGITTGKNTPNEEQIKKRADALIARLVKSRGKRKGESQAEKKAEKDPIFMTIGEGSIAAGSSEAESAGTSPHTLEKPSENSSDLGGTQEKEFFTAPDGRQFFVGQRVEYETRKGDKKEYTIKRLNEFGNIELDGFPSYVSEKRLPFLRSLEEASVAETNERGLADSEEHKFEMPAPGDVVVGEWIPFKTADGKTGKYRIKTLDDYGNIELFEFDGIAGVTGKDRIALLKEILAPKEMVASTQKTLEDLRASSRDLRKKIEAYKEKYQTPSDEAWEKEVRDFWKNQKNIAALEHHQVPVETSAGEYVSDSEWTPDALQKNRALIESFTNRGRTQERESAQGAPTSAVAINSSDSKTQASRPMHEFLEQRKKEEKKKAGWLKRNLKKIAGTLAFLVGAGMVFRGEEVSSSKGRVESAHAIKEYKPEQSREMADELGITISKKDVPIEENTLEIAPDMQEALVEQEVRTLGGVLIKKGEGVLHGLDRIQKLKVDTSAFDSVQKAQWEEFKKKSAAEKRAWRMAQLEEMGFAWTNGKLAYPFTIHPGAELKLYQDPQGQFHARFVENNKVVLHDRLFVKEGGTSVSKKIEKAMQESEENLYGFVEEIANDTDGSMRRSFVYDGAVKTAFERQGASIQDLVDVDGTSKQYIRMTFKNGAVVDVVPEKKNGVWRLRSETASPHVSAQAARAAGDTSDKQRVFTDIKRTVTPFLPETQQAVREASLPVHEKQVVNLASIGDAETKYDGETLRYKDYFQTIVADNRGEELKARVLKKISMFPEVMKHLEKFSEDERVVFLPIERSTGIAIGNYAFKFKNEDGVELLYVHPDKTMLFGKSDNGIALAYNTKTEMMRTIVGAKRGAKGEIIMVLSDDAIKLPEE